VGFEVFGLQGYSSAAVTSCEQVAVKQAKVLYSQRTGLER